MAKKNCTKGVVCGSSCCRKTSATAGGEGSKPPASPDNARVKRSLRYQENKQLKAQYPATNNRASGKLMGKKSDKKATGLDKPSAQFGVQKKAVLAKKPDEQAKRANASLAIFRAQKDNPPTPAQKAAKTRARKLPEKAALKSDQIKAKAINRPDIAKQPRNSPKADAAATTLRNQERMALKRKTGSTAGAMSKAEANAVPPKMRDAYIARYTSTLKANAVDRKIDRVSYDKNKSISASAAQKMSKPSTAARPTSAAHAQAVRDARSGAGKKSTTKRK